jgi:amidase
VAAGLVPIAHGSDGGGSIRIPGSCCGLFGLKPSRGRVSSAPFPSLDGFSTAGSLARSVADAAAFLDVLAGYEPGDPWWAPPPDRAFAAEVGADPGRLRIGVTAEPPIETPVHPDCIEALRSAAELLEELGHEIEDIPSPWSEPNLLDMFITVWQVGPTLYPVDPDALTPLNRELAELARATPATEYAEASAFLQTAGRRIVSNMSLFDVVLAPTLALPPVPIGWQLEGTPGALEQLHRNTEFTPFTAIANVTGLPAMTVPLHWSSDGLPIGVQVFGRPAGEAQLLRLAAQLEEARPWHDRRPPIS